MSNKKETPVSWLMDKLKFIDKNSYNELYEHFDHALQMEALKPQKYEEILAMLDKVAPTLERYGEIEQYKEVIQLIKEAKEL